MVMPYDEAARELYHEVLAVMDGAFARLESQVQKPIKIEMHGHWAYRYAEQTIHQAMVLKLVRVVSGLRTAQILLEVGHVQEQGVFQRILDELNEDIFFLVLGANDAGPLHQEYLDYFFQEEFEDGKTALESAQKRGMVSRKKIRAYLASKTIDPSTGINVSKTVFNTYSGFVHAAAGHILEMYGGSPPQFHMSGMLGTPRAEEYGQDLGNYFFRSLLSFIGVAKAFGDAELVASLYGFRDRFDEVSSGAYQLKGSASTKSK
jgi:hypothetical protein